MKKGCHHDSPERPHIIKGTPSKDASFQITNNGSKSSDSIMAAFHNVAIIHHQNLS